VALIQIKRRLAAKIWIENGPDAMLTSAFIVLSCTIAFGCALALVHLRSGKAAPVAWWVAALHGLIGLGGLGLLALALRGPVRGLAQGTGSFGIISASLIASAAIIGGMILTRHRKGQHAGALIGVHATLAIGGFVMLAAYVMA
jgi:O-antigen/teichoic acid export membrane protein